MKMLIDKRSEDTYIVNATLDSGFSMSLNFNHLPSEQEVVDILINIENTVNNTNGNVLY